VTTSEPFGDRLDGLEAVNLIVELLEERDGEVEPLGSLRSGPNDHISWSSSGMSK